MIFSNANDNQGINFADELLDKLVNSTMDKVKLFEYEIIQILNNNNSLLNYFNKTHPDDIIVFDDDDSREAVAYNYIMTILDVQQSWFDTVSYDKRFEKYINDETTNTDIEEFLMYDVEDSFQEAFYTYLGTL